MFKLTPQEAERRRRLAKWPTIERLRKAGVSRDEALSMTERDAQELLIRVKQGQPLELSEDKWQAINMISESAEMDELTPQVQAKIPALVEAGLCCRDGHIVRLTAVGWALYVMRQALLDIAREPFPDAEGTAKIALRTLGIRTGS